MEQAVIKEKETPVKEEAKDVLFAKNAVPGTEYMTVTGKQVHRVKIAQHGRGKTGMKVWTPGYGYNVSTLWIPDEFLLREIPRSKQKNSTQKKTEKGTLHSREQKPAATAKGKRLLPKLSVAGTPRVEIGGFKFRQNYRYRSNSARIKDCVAARKERCSCRCGGSLHGKSHAEWIKAENEMFNASKTGAIKAEDFLALINKFGGIQANKTAVKASLKSKK